MEPVKQYEVYGYRPGTIPEWLARAAHAELARVLGDGAPDFEAHMKKAGFDKLELLDLLAGGTGNRHLLDARTAKIELTQEETHRAIIDGVHGFTSAASADPEKRQALTLLIIKVATWLNEQGFRPRDVASSTLALVATKGDLNG